MKFWKRNVKNTVIIDEITAPILIDFFDGATSLRILDFELAGAGDYTNDQPP